MRAAALFWCILLAAAAVATAQARVQFGSGDPFVVDSTTAYIFYRTRMPGANIRFLRERDLEDSADSGPAVDSMPGPERWIQVDGRGARFSKGREDTYLRAVRPGSYILYGNIGAGPNGAHIGVCHCMGSVRFEARAGQIVDLGEIVYPSPKAPRPWGVSIVPLTPDMSVPPRLSGLPRVAAQFHAAPKMANYFGVEIDRHDPIPGVLSYRRDIPIDVGTGRPATALR
jgi:hypothetical protein